MPATVRPTRPSKSTNKKMSPGLKILLAVLGIVLAVWIARGGTASQPEGINEGAYIHAMQDSIQYRMTDPASTVFRDVHLHRGTEGVPAVCGQVNSKNRLGGFAGYERFIAAGSVHVLESDMQPGAMDVSWARFCQ